jgi:hypothetical protein
VPRLPTAVNMIGPAKDTVVPVMPVGVNAAAVVAMSAGPTKTFAVV